MPVLSKVGVACLVALAAAEQPVSLSAVRKHQHKAAGKAAAHDVGISQVVKSLGEVLSGIEKYEKDATAAADGREKTCTDMGKNLKEQQRLGTRAVSRAKENLDAINADSEGLSAGLDETVKKIASTSGDIDGLLARLKKLREDQKARAAAAAASLQQVDVVIAQTTLKARSARAQRALAQQAPKKDLETLSELGGQLASNDAQEASEDAPPSFVQATTQRHRHHKRHSAKDSEEADVQQEPALLALQEDKKQLQQATEDANNDFDEQEKELLEMIRLKQENLKKLETQKEEQQPEVANKLKQAAETKLQLKSAERSLGRDQEMEKTVGARCELMATVFKEEYKQMGKLEGLYKMSKKMLESMDASMFLVKDMQALRGEGAAPSFLQLKSATASNASATVPMSFVQEEADEEQDPQPDSSLLQRASTAAAAAAGGPFDEISQMIQALIASLREQANDDLNKHQFCQESTAKNRNERLSIAKAIDIKASEIHWAEVAVGELQDQVQYLEKETARLQAAATQAADDLKKDEASREKFKKDLQATKETTSSSIIVLTNLCDLAGSAASASAAASFLQVSSTMNKNSQCGQVAKMLEEALDVIYATEKVNEDNLKKVQEQLNGEKTQASDAAEARNADLLQAKSSLGRRGDELAAAKTELDGKKNDLSLVDKAAKQLETNCGPKVESHEERQARRQDEIDALKNALSVLEGDAIPVPM
eukprot:TRINITY_DN3668_c0_g1_i1.p1 TRINITY_DN3668_c0_g1~~TRINITY_DN3668_c0_g1_i1.p1  ORF type:complete len:714 (+),score=314.30 TRINITY_DN3668_c0_g1_i1:138-2279(+)